MKPGPKPPRLPALGAVVRDQFGLPWKRAKRLIATGKVFVDGRMEQNPGFRPSLSANVEVRENSPTLRNEAACVQIVYQDEHLVLIDKPEGMNSVPYHADERDTAIDALRAAWRIRGEKATGPVHVVHRIDKATSGLLLFARSKAAERGLGLQFRDHSLRREYLCVANGHMESQRIESYLLRDRGDGFRGSNRHDRQGKRAVTHVRLDKKLHHASLCTVTLETGRTHQIRIHVSEAGHSLVGEKVYSKDAEVRGDRLIDCPRLLLHARTLGFHHPVRDQEMDFEAALPSSFTSVLATLAQR